MNIYIFTNRKIVKHDTEGNVGENNAEIMNFHFPEKIVGIDMSNITKWIRFKNEELDLIQMIEKDQYSLTNFITQYESVNYQVLLKYGEIVLWKSNVAKLDFGKSLEDEVTISLDELSILNQLKLNVEKLNEQYKDVIKDGQADINELIKRIEDLETKIISAENSRVEAEEKRVIAENERVQAESERNQTLANLVKEVEDTILRLAHSVDEYNTNAQEQLNRLQNTADIGVSAVNSSKNIVITEIQTEKSNVIEAIGNEVNQRVTEFDNHVKTKTTEFDENSTSKTNIFNNNATSKTTTFNTNVTNKTDSFNTDVSNKMKTFNDNAEEKLNNFNENAENYEKKHIYHKVTVTEEIAELTEYEMPFDYIVGNDDFEIYYNNEYLIREKNEDDIANYREIGQPGTTSNKVMFGWNIEVGQVLTFVKKGAVEND